jgi:hypothetical protein
VEAGSDNLRPRKEFQGMVDVLIARDKSVTPLPIWGGVA